MVITVVAVVVLVNTVEPIWHLLVRLLKHLILVQVSVMLADYKQTLLMVQVVEELVLLVVYPLVVTVVMAE
jgi:hypothetical protein